MTPAEQVATHLRDCIFRRLWSGEIPGATALAKQLGVDHRTVITAFRLMENEGIIVSQGAGKRRMIVLPDKYTPPSLRVQILLYEDWDRQQPHMVKLIHDLNDMGHSAGMSSKTLLDLDMNLGKIISYSEKIEADAWIIVGGSQEVLEWFASYRVPAFAYAGRLRDVAIAGIGPDKIPAMRTAVRRLHELGHRRIVLICREDRRKPIPGFFERLFIHELEHLGIATGSYNLPDWQDTTQDFHRCIDALMRHTPPSAIIIDEMQPFIAAQQHLAQHGLIAPRDISLICCDPHLAFDWYSPSISHIHWQAEPIVRRIVKWVDNMARGKEDRSTNHIRAEFVEGGTIGPVSKP